ncbi:unnamed protein product [Menidia menidia]|uniref:(Atlantic silverside) hypothetical protein n=1 Tax=Menidia menidia TaxID=238744 RepID=A0A8S4B4N2_9TELE|nr:unnamed protein product [Menidia menidia]CAG5913632.1 unnamed protein product [Menidia menidia]
MIFSMGCGGSRADAIIEPRYHESWTRETESTWLTNTDVESPVSVPNSKALEAGLKEKRMVTTGTQCGKQALASGGSGHQRRARRSGSDQSARESKRRASKEANGLAKDGQAVGIHGFLVADGNDWQREHALPPPSKDLRTLRFLLCHCMREEESG